jgi:hypothetical protein
MLSPKELAIAGRETRRACSVTLDPLEMLARLRRYIPPPGQGMGRPQLTASRTP